MQPLDEALLLLADRGEDLPVEVLVQRLEAQLTLDGTRSFTAPTMDGRAVTEPTVSPDTSTVRSRRWWRGPLVAVGTAMVTVAVVAVAVLVIIGSADRSEPDVARTEIAAIDAEPTADAEPWVWSRVEDSTGVLGGPGTPMVMEMIAGGPGLVAVGTADGSGSQTGSIVGWDNFDWLDYQDAAVWTSPDGVTWDRVAHDEAVFGSGVATMTSVADNGSRLVAVGIAKTPSGSAGVVWVSDDHGATWQRVPHDESVFGGERQHRMYTVIAADGGFIAAGDDLWSSPDGWTWTRHGPLPGIRSLYRTSTGYVAVGEADYTARVWTSPDGLTWNPVEPPDETLFGGTLDTGHVWASVNDVVEGPDGIVAVGQASPPSEGLPVDADATVWRSPDGEQWNRLPPLEGTVTFPAHQTIRAVTRVDDQLVAVGYQRRHNGGALYGPALSWRSTDGGVTWNPLDGEPDALGERGDNIAIRDLVNVDGNTIVAIGNDGDQIAVWTIATR